MKKLTVILFENNLKYKDHADEVCELFADLSKEKEFCGVWGEIGCNEDEVLSAISATVNHFIKSGDKTEVIFGCCKKDYAQVMAKIDTWECTVFPVPCEDL